MKQIGLVPELVVMDIHKSLDFYTNLLGFSIVFQREQEDFAYLRKGNAEIMLEQPGKTRVWQTGEFKYPLGIGINFSIEVDNVDDLYNKVISLNLPIFLPLEEKWYNQVTRMVGNKQFMIQDPDGYLLRFIQNLGVKEN
jgi:catechol 2,3-dioxygenase-like lactoylglutathione lyase family enzyme